MLPYSAYDYRTARYSHSRDDLFSQHASASLELSLNQPASQSLWYSPARSFVAQPQSQNASASNQLIISEYVEGSGYNKAIEITNIGDSALALDGVTLSLYSNGNHTANSVLDLSNQGALGAGQSLTIAHPSADADVLSHADITSGVINFNGNDAIALADSSGEVLDIVGTIGDDHNFAKDVTLRRDADVTHGATHFDSSQWESYPVDSFDDLGTFSSEPGSDDDSDDGDTPPDPDTITLISSIQGSGPVSPLVGDQVTVEAVVTMNAQDGLSGFFIEEEDADWDDDDTTSEGIFVYTPEAETLHEGDKVRLSATVDNYQGKNELKNVTQLDVLDHDQALPSMTTVTLPVFDTSSLFSYQGMRVAFEAEDGTPLTVTDTYELGRYGSVTLSSGGRVIQYTEDHRPDQAGYQQWLDDTEARTIVLDDASNAQNPAEVLFGRGGEPLSMDNPLRSGDTLQRAEGILDFNHQQWRVQTQQGQDFQPANPRPDHPDTDALGDANLKVASFNVLNYFNTLDTKGATTTTPAGTQHDPRGADNEQEFERQQHKIVTAINDSDADVVGLMEIENNGYGDDSAIANLVTALNSDNPDADWHYITPRDANGNILSPGSDAISVGMIYKASSVTPEGNAAINDDGAFAYGNRPPMAQTFSENSSGETFTLVVNHLKSKGSVLDGQEDIGDGQGNNVGVRTEAAQQLADWLATDPTDSHDSDFLLVGDFNSYAQEDPITLLEQQGYALLDDDYSYSFNGAWGSLDHALASGSMQQQVTGTSTWHINSDEPIIFDYNTEFKSDEQIDDFYAPDAFRASDHDPVVVGVNLDSQALDLAA
ncbi:hypothetical protein R84981_000335 [Carnimonas sp. R-84981]|uniref:ExeM/NucH family extracellular endonuclease n=1 Tax=Carnimonas bestiolae TaxID=3402172 RepID=UPI003EDBDA21